MDEEPEIGMRPEGGGIGPVNREEGGGPYRVVLLEKHVEHTSEPTLRAAHARPRPAHRRRSHARVHPAAHARPVLLNLGEPGGFDLSPWVNRVRMVDANHDGVWELPVLGDDHSARQGPSARTQPPDKEIEKMATFVLIHGAGDVGWYWHLLDKELRQRGHEVVAPDLPCDDESAGLAEYADTVVDAIGDRRDLVVVGQSFGGFTAPLVADRLAVDLLVLVAGMVPDPGEPPADWWSNTGYEQAVQEQARRDDGLTGNQDPFVLFYHDVPRALAEEALSKERSESNTAYHDPWPLDAWPAVPTKFVLCLEDRVFPANFMQRVVAERLAIAPDEINAGHCVALSRPNELADLLVGYIATPEEP